MEDPKEQCTPQPSALQAVRVTQITCILLCVGLFLRATLITDTQDTGHQEL